MERGCSLSYPSDACPCEIRLEVAMARIWVLLAAALAGIQSLAADDFPIPALVISDSVRIRSAPSLSGQILGKADHGTQVTVLARSKTATAVTRGGERNWWYQIETGDHRKGWMYGAFVYLEAKAENQKGLSFKIGVDGKQTRFSTRIYTSSVAARPGQTRSLICLADEAGSIQFIQVPQNLVEMVHSLHNEDHWYLMLSDRKTAQFLRDVSVMEDQNLVKFEISEQAGGTEIYGITLTCSYNPDKHWFQVEFSETVPQ
jgi:uncharacterized protein YgiM (DUF1202 family)